MAGEKEAETVGVAKAGKAAMAAEEKAEVMGGGATPVAVTAVAEVEAVRKEVEGLGSRAPSAADCSVAAELAGLAEEAVEVGAVEVQVG